MNKLQQIAQDLKDNPTLFDYFSYSREWTTQELNQLMLAEYLDDVKGLAVKMNRSDYSVILKYLELRENLDAKLAYDVRVLKGPYSMNDVHVVESDWDIEDFIQGVSVVNMGLEDILEVNVRIVDPALRENIPDALTTLWSHFMTVPTNGGTGGLYGTRRTTCLDLPLTETNPDKWSLLRFYAAQEGSLQIGMSIRDTVEDAFAISKTLLVNIG